MQKTNVDWQYYAETNTACVVSGENKCFWPRGKMLGNVKLIDKAGILK